MNRKCIILISAALVFVGSANAQSFRFTASCDNRPVQGENIPYWEWALDEITRTVGDEGVFHVIPGDFDYPGTTDASLKAQFGTDVVWYPVVGNHELDTESGSGDDFAWVKAAYPTLPNIVNPGPPGCETTTYSWDYGNAHFIALNQYYNGTSDRGTDGDVVDALYNWLVADLAANTLPAVFVIGHEPAYPEVRHTTDSLNKYPARRDRFWKLLNDEGVIAYFCGHTHAYYAKQVDGPDWDPVTWQVDCGNSGNGTTNTFIDVTVSDIDVTFNVWQAVIGSTFSEVPYSNIETWVVDLPAPVYKAHNPSPSDSASCIAPDALLAWSAGAGAVSHDIYFGLDADPRNNTVINHPDATYDPGTLISDTTYFWAVDERDSQDGVTPGDIWSFTTAGAPTAASNPDPDGTALVAVDSALSWAAGSCVTSHDVFFGTDNPPLFAVNQAGNTYDPGQMAYDTTYYLRIDELGPGGSAQGAVWSFTTEGIPDSEALSDVPVKGDIGGTFADTQESDDVYQTITEKQSGGKPANRYSLLEHKWTFSIPQADAKIFHVEARKTVSTDNDNFVFAYSTDDQTYTDMVELSKTEDDNTYQTYVLPTGLIGTVYVRVTDTDHSPGNRSLDTVSIDHMYIQCEGSGEPDTDPPAAPTALTAAAAGASQIDLDWADNAEPDLLGYNVKRSDTGGGPYTAIAANVTASSYSDTGLMPSTTYYYIVTAVDTSSNESVGTSNEASAATLQLSLPGQATDPTPSDGQDRVNNRSVILSWIAGTDAESHDVYLGTDSGSLPRVSAGQNQTTYDPPTLDKKTTYYWRIDEINTAGTQTGLVWSFTTR